MNLKWFGSNIFIKKEVLIAAGICLALILGWTGYMISRRGGDVIVEKGGSLQGASMSGAQTEISRTGPDVMDAHEQSADGAQNGSASPGSAAGGEADNAFTGGTAAGTMPAEDEIKVYVVGCVRNPGIVTLRKGQLIDDAVRAAGGATEGAALDSINLVYTLKENVMLRIYSRKEIQPAAGGSEAGKGVKLVRDSGGSVIGDSGASDGKNARVNINTASVSELDTLPGIGEATAKEIIAYREKNGPFKNIKGIMKVPRIKESRFNSIRDYIAVK